LEQLLFMPDERILVGNDLSPETRRKVARRLTSYFKGLETLPQLEEPNTTIYDTIKKPVGLGVPQNNKCARALEALANVEERQTY